MIKMKNDILKNQITIEVSKKNFQNLSGCTYGTQQSDNEIFVATSI